MLLQASGQAAALRALPGIVPMRQLTATLRRMGQDLLAPPTVKGWDGGRSWLSTSTVLNRVNFDLPETLVQQETRNVVYNIVSENHPARRQVLAQARQRRRAVPAGQRRQRAEPRQALTRPTEFVRQPVQRERVAEFGGIATEIVGAQHRSVFGRRARFSRQHGVPSLLITAIRERPRPANMRYCPVTHGYEF